MRKAFVGGAIALAVIAAPVLARAQQPGQTPGAGQKTPGHDQPGHDPAVRDTAKGTASPDQKFVVEAAKGGMAEVELGRLAAEKGSSDQMKKFGQRMVDDHGKANDELKSMAQSKNITLPAAVEPKAQALHDRLSKLSGAEFDRAYMREMVADHRKDVNAFRRESQSGKDTEFKTWAGKTLPTLEEHLKMAEDANRGVVATSGTKSNDKAGDSGQSGKPGSTTGTSRPGTSGTTGTPDTTPKR
jgi:putative membrane protein